MKRLSIDCRIAVVTTFATLQLHTKEAISESYGMGFCSIRLNLYCNSMLQSPKGYVINTLYPVAMYTTDVMKISS
jgi:hypothetical protein